MPDIVRIEPHHFLDIITGFGAGQEFKPSLYGHAVHLVAEKVLSDHNIMLELVLGCDDICEPCVNYKDGRCIDVTSSPGRTVSKYEWNKTIDKRLFERLGLKEGTRIRTSDFCRIAFERLGNIYDIWREIPRNLTSIRERNLMRGLSKYLEKTPHSESL